jgi:asparagine synthase (glutamine-hydrolysing)
LVSDVPVATALSGGLDSSSVYSIVNDLIKGEKLSRVPQNSQKAVVVTFPGLENDERVYAEKAIVYTGGEALFLPQEYPDLAEQITKDTIHFDGLNPSPITAISGIYRGMRQNGITVSLDGHGVDEMMYGYRDMMYNLFDYYFKSGNKTAANMLRSTIVPTYADNEQQRVQANLESMMKSASSPLSGIKNLAKKILRKNELNRADYRSSNLWEPLGEPYDFSHLSYPERILYNETFVETLPDIFRNFDLAGMMNSVEIRMPFMDWRLVAYTFSLPVESKIGKGYNKLILREAMNGRMAEEIRTRRLKIGISSPVHRWFNHELKGWVHEMSIQKDFIESIPKGKEHAESCLKQLNSGKADHETVIKLWCDLNLYLINK